MTRRSKIWLAVASIFTVVNFAGAVQAAAAGQALHTGAHVALFLVGAYFLSRLAPRTRRLHVTGAQQADERLEHLQQSVDAIALEVERIGEAQRFITKLAAEQADPSTKDASPARLPNEYR
jgi:hypothetical protein